MSILIVFILRYSLTGLFISELIVVWGTTIHVTYRCGCSPTSYTVHHFRIWVSNYFLHGSGWVYLEETTSQRVSRLKFCASEIV